MTDATSPADDPSYQSEIQFSKPPFR